MIEKRTLARPYAKALFSLASETKSFDEWSHFLAWLSLVVNDENTKNLIEDSTQPPEEIKRFLFQLCLDFPNEMVKNFIQLLVVKKRLYLLEEIAELFEAMCREFEGKIEVSFFSPIALTVSQKDRFSDLLATYFKRMVKVEWTIDEHLFGGFLIKVGNETIDGSLRGQLTALKALVSD